MPLKLMKHKSTFCTKVLGSVPECCCPGTFPLILGSHELSGEPEAYYQPNFHDHWIRMHGTCYVVAWQQCSKSCQLISSPLTLPLPVSNRSPTNGKEQGHSLACWSDTRPGWGELFSSVSFTKHLHNCTMTSVWSESVGWWRKKVRLRMS